MWQESLNRAIEEVKACIEKLKPLVSPEARKEACSLRHHYSDYWGVAALRTKDKTASKLSSLKTALELLEGVKLEEESENKEYNLKLKKKR